MQEHIEATKLARQLRRIEEITIAEELRQDLHALADEISRREWTCPRFECHRHKFLSKARYDTHMKVHRLMDVEVEEARRKVFEEKMRRMGEEEQVRSCQLLLMLLLLLLLLLVLQCFMVNFIVLTLVYVVSCLTFCVIPAFSASYFFPPHL